MRIGANHYIRPEATLRRFGRYGVQGDTAIAQPPSCVERRDALHPESNQITQAIPASASSILVLVKMHERCVAGEQ